MNTGDIARATLITEKGKEVLFILFRMPKFGDKDFYRQSVSIECFRERQSKLIGQNVKRCRITTEPCLGSDEDADPDTVDALPTVWAMYEAIGYDYKRQKWRYSFRKSS